MANISVKMAKGVEVQHGATSFSHDDYMRVATWRNCNKLHLLRPWYLCPWVCRGKPSIRILDGLGLPLSPLKSVAAHLVDPKHASDDCLFPAFPSRNHVLHMFWHSSFRASCAYQDFTPIRFFGTSVMMSQLLLMRLADPTHWPRGFVLGPWVVALEGGVAKIWWIEQSQDITMYTMYIMPWWSLMIRLRLIDYGLMALQILRWPHRKGQETLALPGLYTSQLDTGINSPWKCCRCYPGLWKQEGANWSCPILGLEYWMILDDTGCIQMRL